MPAYAFAAAYCLAILAFAWVVWFTRPKARARRLLKAEQESALRWLRFSVWELGNAYKNYAKEDAGFLHLSRLAANVVKHEMDCRKLGIADPMKNPYLED